MASSNKALGLNRARCRGTTVGGARCMRAANQCPTCGEMRCLAHTECGHRERRRGGQPPKSPGRPCTKCGETKPLTEYYRRPGGGRLPHCKRCQISAVQGHAGRSSTAA